MLTTVTGDVATQNSKVLVHEHLQIDLSACKGDSVVLDETDMVHIIEDLEYAKACYDLGVIVDATVKSAGRRLDVLRRISEESDVYIVGATGFHWELYTDDIKCAEVGELRKKMVEELTVGSESGEICCGVIKVGTDSESLNAVDERMFQAAGLASCDTGAPIITHTSKEGQAAWQLDRLEEVGVDLGKVLIGHLDKYDNALELAREVGKRGAFIGIDQIGFSKKRPDKERAEVVRELCVEGFDEQILLSSDISSANQLRANGGRSYCTVLECFLPLLRHEGLQEHSLAQITNGNPQEWLGLSV